VTNQDPIARFQAAYHSSPERIHLNNAGVAPTCRAAHDTIQKWNDRFFVEGFSGVMAAIPDLIRTREEVAQLFGANSSEEVAFFTSAASAISQIAFGFKFKPGDEILVWDQEYPSNLYPWAEAAKRDGAKLVIAPSGPNLETPAEKLLSFITPRTRLIAFSWVQYRTGAITEIEDVTAVAKSKGIFTCADIIQGAGILPFDFKSSGLDAAACGSQKWLTSSLSTGFLFLRQEHLEKLAPLAVGAMTFGGSEVPFTADAPMAPGARRFEPGSKNFCDVLALGATAAFLKEIGIARIAQEVEWLTRHFSHGLQERGYTVHSPHGRHHRGGILNFTPGPNAAARTLDEIEARLQKLGASFAKRAPGIRVSPHAFNTKDELDRVLSVL
jgi:cysteine desulfurase/selenocysteine lyase